MGSEKLTNKSKELLIELEKKYKDELRVKLFEAGASASDATGDGYHDALFAMAHREVDLAKSRVKSVDILLATAEKQEIPTQFETVELGHQVSVSFFDDLKRKEPAKITILTAGNIEVLKDSFNMEENILVSDASPLGLALLGAKINQTVTFNGSFEVMVEGIGVDPSIF